MKPVLRRRIVVALAALAALMALSAVLALFTHRALRAEIATAADAERDRHAALLLALAARDLYAHQAHSIILNDRSHLVHIGQVEQEVETLLTALRGFVAGTELVPAVEHIAETIDILRRHFDDVVVPLLGGARDALVAPHDRMMAHIDAITAATDRLTGELQRRALAARAQADAQTSREAVVMVALAVLATVFAALGGVYLTRLARTERLASVGALAAGVAHEVNNPLTAILGHARLLSRAADTDVSESARAILSEAERCQVIVRALLDLTRPQRLQPVSVAVHELIDDVVEALAASGKTTPITIDGASVVEADAPKLRQIVWNLLLNACEANPAGPVRVAISRDERVHVRVSDAGPGVAPELRARLFEPFVTSKPAGSGLGLAVSAALAQAHGGSLKLVPSEVGATFELELPKEARA